MRSFLAVIALTLAAACSAEKPAQPPADPTDAAGANEEALVEDVLQPPADDAKTIEDFRAESLAAIDQDVCAAAGGEVRMEGMLGMYRCVKPYADAGKACRSSDDCEGKCLASGPEATGEEAVGACQANDSPFGCYAEIEDGKVANAICVD